MEGLVIGALPGTGPSLRTRLIVWLGSAIILCGVCVLFLDQPISTWSHDMLHRPAIAVLITKAADAKFLGLASLVALLAALVARVFGVPLGRGWRTLIAAALATLLAMLAVTFTKYGFGRLWPETWVQHNPSWIGNQAYGFLPFHGGAGFESFPSGHTARITAPFAVLWHRLPRLRVIWALPPLIIAAALIAADFHFLSDCIAGAYLAVACAAGVLMLV